MSRVDTNQGTHKLNKLKEKQLNQCAHFTLPHLAALCRQMKNGLINQYVKSSKKHIRMNLIFCL